MFPVISTYDRLFHFLLKKNKMSHLNNVIRNITYYYQFATYLAFNISKKIHLFRLLTSLIGFRFRFCLA